MDLKPIEFKLSVPGKVILHGEHSVVYGKPAIAGAIDARNYLHFREDKSDVVSLNYSAISVKIKIPIAAVNEMIKNAKPSEEIISSIKIPNEFQIELDLLVPTDEGKKAVHSTLVLLAAILLNHKLPKLIEGFQIKITSQLSVGAGLGSSASFGVCLAAAFLTFARLKSGNIKSLELTTDDKRSISQWAFETEKIMHGTPSGIDNTVCTFGHLVKFTKSKPIEHIDVSGRINILLVDSGVVRSTATLVKNVADLKQQFPLIFEAILTALEQIAEEAIPIYMSKSTGKEDFEKLEKLFQMNNDLLKTIGVSHPRLEEIFRLAAKFGFSSKLTGAGGGGYSLILLPDGYQKMESFQRLVQSLQSAGFQFIETTVGGSGLKFEQI